MGITGMQSQAFEYFMECLCRGQKVSLMDCFAHSECLSADVTNAYDPTYGETCDKRNNSRINGGVCFMKYTGARGKSGSSDAPAEFVAKIRRLCDEGGVIWQMGELGKVDAGGGGTIAYIPAKYGMDVIDSGVAVLSMHSPWEATSKADIYEAERGYEAFLRA